MSESTPFSVRVSSHMFSAKASVSLNVVFGGGLDVVVGAAANVMIGGKIHLSPAEITLACGGSCKIGRNKQLVLSINRGINYFVSMEKAKKVTDNYGKFITELTADVTVGENQIGSNDDGATIVDANASIAGDDTNVRETIESTAEQKAQTVDNNLFSGKTYEHFIDRINSINEKIATKAREVETTIGNLEGTVQMDTLLSKLTEIGFSRELDLN